MAPYDYKFLVSWTDDDGRARFATFWDHDPKGLISKLVEIHREGTSVVKIETILVEM